MMTKIITWAVVIIVVIGGGFWAWQSGMLKSLIPGGQTTQPTNTQQADNTQQQAPQSDLPTGNSDASDAALTQDTVAVDGQLSAYAQDSAAVDQSLSDKQTAQEY